MPGGDSVGEEIRGSGTSLKGEAWLKRQRQAKGSFPSPGTPLPGN